MSFNMWHKLWAFFCRINIPYIDAKNCLKKCPFCLGKGTRSGVFLKKINREFVCNTNRSAYILRLLSLVGNKLRLDLLCVRGSEN